MRLSSIFESLLVLCFVAVASHTLAQTGAAELKQDWKVQATRAMEDQQLRALARKGGFYSKQMAILEDLLKAAPRDVMEAEFERVCEAKVPDVFEKDNELDRNYDRVLLLAFLERSVTLRDGERLRRLLSHHCPRYVVYFPLEFFLEIRWPGSIDYLFGCSLSAESPAVKNDALFCLGRAFPSLRQRFSKDGEFVQQAKSWYAAHRSSLRVNHMYEYLPSLPPPPPSGGEDRTNLFLLKPK